MDFEKILIPQAGEQNNMNVVVRERDPENRELLRAITSYSFSIYKAVKLKSMDFTMMGWKPWILQPLCCLI